MDREARLVGLNIADTTLRQQPDIKAVKEKLDKSEAAARCEELGELAREKALLGRLLYEEKHEFGVNEEGEIQFVERDIVERDIRGEELLPGPIYHLRAKLEEVEKEILDLVSYPQVVERYREEFTGKVGVLSLAREVEGQRLLIEQLEEQNVELLVRRQGTGLSSADEDFLQYNRDLIYKAMVLVEDRLADPLVETELRRRELVRYRRQLKEQRIAETPTVKRYLREIRDALRRGQPVFLWGPTGGGKTEYSRLLAKQMYGKEAEILSGGEEINQYDIFGTKGFDKEGTFLELGPLPTAWQEKALFVADEIDLMPHAVVGELHDILTRKAGDKVRIPGTSERFTIPAASEYGFVATGNLRSEKYVQRQKLDPALLRRFWKREIRYLPPEENFDILLACLIDRKGTLELSNPGEDLGNLQKLCQAAEFIQLVFMGEKTDFWGEGSSKARGIGSSLENAVLSIGDLINIVKVWKISNFAHPLEDFILTECIYSQTVRQDQLNLVKIFCLHGFFQNRHAVELGIIGLTEDKLAAYRAETAEKKEEKKEA